MIEKTSWVALFPAIHKNVDEGLQRDRVFRLVHQLLDLLSLGLSQIRLRCRE